MFNSKVVAADSLTNVVSLSGLCPDWETWDPVKPVENATEAMQLADDWLGIPQVGFHLFVLRCCRSVPCCGSFKHFIHFYRMIIVNILANLLRLTPDFAIEPFSFCLIFSFI